MTSVHQAQQGVAHQQPFRRAARRRQQPEALEVAAVGQPPAFLPAGPGWEGRQGHKAIVKVLRWVAAWKVTVARALSTATIPEHKHSLVER